MNYSTGALCRLLGIGEKTLRLYEQKGLLAPERREGSAYRAYTARDLERLLEIKKYQSEQRSLAEITELVSGMPFEASQAMLDENIEALQRQIESLQLALFHLSGMRRNRQGNYDHLGKVRPLQWDKADRYVILDSDQPVPRREEAFAILRDWSFERAELNLIAVCEPHRLTEKGFCGCSLAILNKTPEAAPTPDDELIHHVPTGPALSLSFLARSMGEIRPEQLDPLKPHFEDGILPERIYVTHNVRLLQDGEQRLLLRALAFGV